MWLSLISDHRSNHCEIEWWRTGWLQLEPPFLFSNNHRRERWFSVSTEPMRGIDVWLFQVNILNIVGSRNSQYDFPKKMDHPKRVHSNNTCPQLSTFLKNPYSPRYRHQKERCYNLEYPDFGSPHPLQVAPEFRHSCWISCLEVFVKQRPKCTRFDIIEQEIDSGDVLSTLVVKKCYCFINLGVRKKNEKLTEYMSPIMCLDKSH